MLEDSIVGMIYSFAVVVLSGLFASFKKHHLLQQSFEFIAQIIFAIQINLFSLYTLFIRVRNLFAEGVGLLIPPLSIGCLYLLAFLVKTNQVSVCHLCDILAVVHPDLVSYIGS